LKFSCAVLSKHK